MSSNKHPHWQREGHRWPDPSWPRHWPADRDGRRRFFMRRILGAFIAFFLLVLALLLVVIALLIGPIADWLQTPGWLLAGICGLSIIFTLLVAMVAGWVFRRVGRPTVDVLAAIDAVAGGDFGIRVREDVPGEFGRLAQRFNHMVSELERSEQQRRNLTADVAHELRNPLHIIQGNLEGMLDGVYPASPEQIEATLEETRLLVRLVDDLQTLSLAEAGQLPLHRTVFSVVDLLADVVTSFGTAAEDANVELRIEVPHDGDLLELNADPDRLYQVLSNLVGNALRYTPAGGQITLKAEAIADGVRLSVEDSGEGIHAEDLPFVFDRFWRGDRARVRWGGTGSGLGLAIARQLVQAHDGQINVESQPGRGTRFVIELPLGQ